MSSVTGLAWDVTGKSGMPFRVEVGEGRCRERRANSDTISPIGRFSRSAMALAAASTSSSMVKVVRIVLSSQHQASVIAHHIGCCFDHQYAAEPSRSLAHVASLGCPSLVA
jgi:hypothetical protein